MKTTFKTLRLDRLRYSQVWEDSKVIENVLRVNANDDVLVITSGGTNVLNTLLFDPRTIYATDLNPKQNEFLSLQLFIIKHFDVDDYLSVMGYAGKEAYQKIRPIIQSHFSSTESKQWSEFFEHTEAGLSVSGKLEAYITSFYPSLAPSSQKLIQELFNSDSIQAQIQTFDSLLQQDFDKQFISYFDRANLSKGRNLNLYKHSSTTGGDLFFQRFKAFIKQYLLRDNFIANFFFFGPQNERESLIPWFCQGDNYEIVKSRLNRIHLINSEAIDFLLSENGMHINKAVLSNIFEYVSLQEFKKAIFSLKEDRNEPMQLLFWNLLNDQGADKIYTPLQDQNLNEEAKKLESCFFFGTLRHFSL